MQLSGKVALVTGASRRGQIGPVVAAALAAEGASLVLAARNAEGLAQVAEDLRARGAEVVTVAADLATPEGAEAAVQAAIERYGRLDILVNVAGGLTVYKAAADHTPEEWDQELDNNLRTAFLCCRAAFPVMVRQGGGRIINFSRGGLPQKNMLAYNCAKAGIEALTRTLALEGRQHNILVNAVAPGLTDTESNVAALKPESLDRWTRREDIAATVVFLASPAGSGVNGQVIAVMGKGIA